MGGSGGGSRTPGQALTDIAGAVVGGGAQLCELANSQDESLVQFYSEVLAFSFFRNHGEMVPSPWSLLGARRYLGDISGQTTADPPLRNQAGMIKDKDWLNEAIMQATRQVPIGIMGVQETVSIADSAFVAVASYAWWIPDPNGCTHEEALNNNCAAQRRHFEEDIGMWYQAYAASMYEDIFQDAFRRVVRRIGTGPWGAGVWWGDSQMYFLVVWLASSLVGNVELDYYVYDHFVENAGNQCLVLGGPQKCQECIRRGATSLFISEGRCGRLGVQDMIAEFNGRSAESLLRALHSSGPPPTQVFDTLGPTGRDIVRSLESVGRTRSSAIAGTRIFRLLPSRTPCESVALAPIANAKVCYEAAAELGIHAQIVGIRGGADRCQYLDTRGREHAVCSSDTQLASVVTYERISNGTCASANLVAIDTKATCERAAERLGLPVTKATEVRGERRSKAVCFYQDWHGPPALLLDSEPDERAVKLCLRPPLPKYSSAAASRGVPGLSGCKGFEYSGSEGMCKVWTSEVQGSHPAKGSICLQYHGA